MCGIAGIVLREPGHVDGELMSRLSRRLAHRGPDDVGFLWYRGGRVESGRNFPDEGAEAEVVLLHRRLSILDLSDSGWQPMSSPDGRYHILLNGEIYNFVELRRELEALGHRFRSHSDTEVLLAAYAEWGRAALPKLVGMFAFAILDTKARTLFLARDFFGIKPLYYTVEGPGFSFASEIKALLEIPGIPRTVDAERVYAYLAWGLTDHGHRTLLSHVRQLPAAHCVEIALDRPTEVQPERYWNLDTTYRLDLSFDEAASRLRDLFLESVRLHLRSDVPLGAALSGGIDSSAIVTGMRHVLGESAEIHVFSYIADDAAISEERWIDLAAEAARAQVHKVRATTDDLLGDLKALIDSQDVPFGSTSIFAQRRIFQRARESGIKVMLDGQGADEMLGGYHGYAAARVVSLVRQGRAVEAVALLNRASRLPGRRKMWLQCLQRLVPAEVIDVLRRLPGLERRPVTWLNGSWFSERGVQIGPARYARARDQLRHELERTLTETSLPALLRYEDRNSMAASIESRVPFLTPALVSFLLSLPEEYIIAPDGTSKAVFRRAMRGIVPDAILDRRDKIGFATPELRWLRGAESWVDQVLTGEASGRVPVLVSREMVKEWNAIRQGRRPFGFHVWRWINLIEWSHQYGVRYD